MCHIKGEKYYKMIAMILHLRSWFILEDILIIKVKISIQSWFWINHYPQDLSPQIFQVIPQFQFLLLLYFLVLNP